MRESHQSYHSNERSTKNRIARSSLKPTTINSFNHCADRPTLIIPQSNTYQSIQPFFLKIHFQHLPTRASSEKNCLIPHLLTTDSFHLGVTTSAEKIEPNTILLRLNHLAQSRPQFCILAICNITFKHTILHPLTIRLQHLVNFRASLILGNIVGNHHEHKRVEG
jgi:hypothetical protein